MDAKNASVSERRFSYRSCVFYLPTCSLVPTLFGNLYFLLGLGDFAFCLLKKTRMKYDLHCFSRGLCAERVPS